jgi:hypothetical protein
MSGRGRPFQSSFQGIVRKDNALGIKGVCRNKFGTFDAYICRKGKRKNLGRFKAVEEAKAAYEAATVEWHGEFRVPSDQSILAEPRETVQNALDRQHELATQPPPSNGVVP